MRTKRKKLQNTIEEVQDAHRKREDLMKSRIMINNRVKAIKRTVREGEDFEILTQHLSDSMKHIEAQENGYTKLMAQIAVNLPHYEWFTSFEGLNSKSYASIIAETGDLRNYPAPAKVWKRMGLAVDNGEAEKNTKKGQNTGYSKHRRAVMFRVSNAVVYKKGYYRQVYDERKQEEIRRNENGENAEYVRQHRENLLNAFKSAENQRKIKNNMLPASIIDLRAQRYMSKKLLKHIWEHWNEDNF